VEAGFAIDALPVALVGALVVAATLTASVCERFGVPALVGHIAVGFALAALDAEFGFLDETARGALRLLADLGIVALLFAVGLASHPRALLAKLPDASLVWFGNVVLSGGLGFVAAHWLLGLSPIASAVVGVALSATSVGIAVSVWRDAGRLDSPDGDLLVDVAELDDISAMAFMAALFAVIPLLDAGLTVGLADVGAALGDFALRFAGFLAFCVLFTLFLERRVTHFSGRLSRPPERMLVVAGVGWLIAAVAGTLGFSLAIGALFAGLVFSRDPEAVRTETSFEDLYAFLTPFFFIGIGLQMETASLLDAVPLAAALLVVAVLGKFVGTWLPALLATSGTGAVLLGLSMLPRAEIALVVVDQGRAMAPAHVDAALYSAMVLLSAALCALVPLPLGRALQRGGAASRAE
jgi:Kef-type K+ transport system membrane component KefB